ncbi:ethanolamine ammonia-lyase reactivating factor EutA [Clostridium pasteurianum]|uniref:ethanolamine ammonia-lyase reactivating factor EutA n=1 Tax=Clostridium pasteurianum TaxID=1501 RepID=UPI001FA803AF|nr:ethanolamine ammonia-lyase reactivating factor EutA [Clostridium pasteurianum]
MYRLKEEILSVGIDIGTTTTQLIFSKITVNNIAGPFSIPNVKITDKKIIYKSKIYFTPLFSSGKINLEEIKKIIDNEYKKACIAKEDVATGAIIITGETARKENAEQVLSALSEFSGDFVVATAGVDLESILAGYGSGAAEFSKNTASKVINFDIGGGTTNTVLFEAGEVVDAFALDIGGRLIKFDKDCKITYISEKILALIKNLKLNLKIGYVPQIHQLKILTNVFADILVKIAKNEELNKDIEELFIGHKNKKLKAENFMLSGGVSEFVYSDKIINQWKQIVQYGDIGPLLGCSIRDNFKKNRFKISEPKEKIRATVIGVGSYSMDISGSTVVFDNEILQMKNIPIIKLSEDSRGIINDDIINKINLYEGLNVALAFKGPKSPSYEDIKIIAESILDAVKNRNNPVIIIIENDFAKALGQRIKNILKDSKKLICIDGIKVENGDYVDIGKPISSVVPVVIKTLIFKN